MRQAFLGIPTELRDAAAMDGYTHFGFLTRVAVPLVRPSVAALSLFSLLVAWNQYLWPLLVTTDNSKRTVQIGLKKLVSSDVASFNRIACGHADRRLADSGAAHCLRTPTGARPHRWRREGLMMT